MKRMKKESEREGERMTRTNQEMHVDQVYYQFLCHAYFLCNSGRITGVSGRPFQRLQHPEGDHVPHPVANGFFATVG